MARKLVLCIFVCLFSILLMSDNVGAVSNTVYLKNGVYAYGIPYDSGSQGGSSQVLTSGQLYNMQNNVYTFNGKNIWYSMAFKLTPDNAQIDLSSYTDYTFSFSYCSTINYFMPSSNDLFRMTNYYEFEANEYEIMYQPDQTDPYNYNIRDLGRCRNVIMYGKVQENLTYNAFQLGTTNNGSFTRIFGIMPYDDLVTPFYRGLIISSPTVVFYDNENEAMDALEKEKQETQAASDASETAGESAGSDAEASSQSLLNATGSVISALAAAPATDCNINMTTTGNSSSFTGAIGTINLCSSVPSGILSFVQGLLALVLTPIVFYYCYHIVQYLINLFKEYQS